MSTNPVTEMWRSFMNTQQDDLQAKLEERVAINSIYAQRTVERLFVPGKQDEVICQRDNTFAGQPMKACAHADVKNTAAGERSSYEGAVAYAADAVARRDELLAKYASP